LKNKNSQKVFIGIGILLWILFLLQCTPLSPVAGGSTDTGTSSTVGLVVDPKGDPIGGAEVKLFPEKFIPLNVFGDSHSIHDSVVSQVYTDSSGAFFLKEIPMGRYSLLISTSDSASLLSFHESITFFEGFHDLGTDTLFSSGRAVIRIFAPERYPDMVFFVEGMPNYILADLSGVTIFSNLPSGFLSIKGLSKDNSNEFNFRTFIHPMRPTFTGQNNNPEFLISIDTIPKTATRGQVYQTRLNVEETDGDAFFFQFLKSPPKMGINDLSGYLSWVPEASDPDSVEIAITVRDFFGGSDTLTWNIFITN